MASDNLAVIPDDISLKFFPEKVRFSQKSREKGFNYYCQGYIHNVRVESKSGEGLVTVMARCWCSMRKSKPPHRLSMDIGPDKIVDAYCSCKAGLSGHCSHLVGLVKTLQAFKLLNYNRVPDKQSCTSVPQQWHKPRRKKITPIPVTQVVLARPRESRKRKPIICHTDPKTKLPTITLENLTVLQSTVPGTPMEYILGDQLRATTTDTQLGTVALGSILSYQTSHIVQEPEDKDLVTATCSSICGNTEFPYQAPVTLLQEYKAINRDHEVQNPVELEKKTQKQAEDAFWFASRSSRLTASNFSKVFYRISTPSQAFLRSLFPTTTPKYSSTSSTDITSITDPRVYGKRQESNAKAKYLSVYPTRHVHECGFIVNNEYAFLGATPDAKVCDGGQCGLMEIKCPFLARNMMIREACEKVKNFCLKPLDNSFFLKTDHPYYVQVQGQLMVTGASFCDFVVFTQKDLFVQRVLPDRDYMQPLLLKLCTFFKDYAVPFLNKLKEE